MKSEEGDTELCHRYFRKRTMQEKDEEMKIIDKDKEIVGQRNGFL